MTVPDTPAAVSRGFRIGAAVLLTLGIGGVVLGVSLTMLFFVTSGQMPPFGVIGLITFEAMALVGLVLSVIGVVYLFRGRKPKRP